MTSKKRVWETKKQYQKPNLRVYGDIRVLTQAVGSSSMMADGGTGKNPHKTA